MKPNTAVERFAALPANDTRPVVDLAPPDDAALAGATRRLAQLLVAQILHEKGLANDDGLEEESTLERSSYASR